MCEERTTVSCRLADDLHHGVHELAPCEWIERRHGLVEDQQLRALRERERQRDLRLLPAGELAHLAIEWDAEPREARTSGLLVPRSG